MQFDIHSPALTIRESYEFSAQLRLHKLDPQQVQEFVDEVCPYAESMLTGTCGSDVGLHAHAALQTLAVWTRVCLLLLVSLNVSKSSHI